MAPTQDAPFVDHGVASPFSEPRGIVSTTDGEGKNVVLIWLFDHRGGYALLMVDVATGKSWELPTPFPIGGDCPYSSILSSKNRYYTHFNSHFVEFDPSRKQFTFVAKTSPQMAMSMTEDKTGVIWSATYPQCGLVSYNPATGTFTDYGHLNREDWAQYPRSVAVDDSGWVYIGLGYTRSHIIAFQPETRQVVPLMKEEERKQGMPDLYPAENGKVYGQKDPGTEPQWLELYAGRARPIEGVPPSPPKKIITGTQGLFYREFPNGDFLSECDLISKTITVREKASGLTRSVTFSYTSEGAHIMSVATAPDGSVCGGTAFPFRFFRYDPEKDRWENQPCYNQWNTVATQGDRFFVGGYGSGFLLEWNPFAPWTGTEKGNPQSNPRYLAEADPDIYRPHELHALADGKTLVLAGTPAYGATGGGLFIWDREQGSGRLLRHTDILENHSTFSITSLPSGLIVAGTTTAPGTGGQKKATEAQLYFLDPYSGHLLWHQPLFPGAQTYMDLIYDDRNGLVYGFVDWVRYFVFHPEKREVVYQEETNKRLGPCSGGQGPRVFVKGPDGTVYVLMQRVIAIVNPRSLSLVPIGHPPKPITVGGDYASGRLFFACGSRLFSFDVDTDKQTKG
ncbi:MAG: hypothetical protein NZ959_06170 [Armatimonadetes bacterium]|nr:hypothetical protein [Armatimonadota bacterium]MDW8121629.1 hypothetical protein [Armatimonadota bacterium]